MVVVTTSKEHVESGWVDYESGIFHNEKLSGKKSGNIITVTYGALKPEELPYHLNYYQVIRADTEGIDRVLNYIIK